MKTTAVFALLLLVCHVSSDPLADLMREVSQMKGTIQGQAAKLEKLEQQQTVQKVAFSAALRITDPVAVGPLNEDTGLIFKHVLTNIGNAYDPATGVFTAPVKGAYQFQWYMGAHGSANAIAVTLIKNSSQQTFMAYSKQAEGYQIVPQAVTLILEAGNTVFLRLLRTYVVDDALNHHTTFSGHLLFPM